MTRTDKKVGYLPESKDDLTPMSAASGVENVLRIFEGRWKLVILFHLFGGKVLRFSGFRARDPGDLAEDADPATAADGGRRHRQADRAPPGAAEVDIRLTGWGQALCPALDALLTWAAQRETFGPADE